jgi:type II secretory pathway pseudopilin PulG
LISRIAPFYCVLKLENIKYKHKNKTRREQKKMKNFKTQKGITLIALVITIIVLLILAGITINLTIGQNGIITTAQQAGKNYQQAAEDEQTQLAEFLQETTGTVNALQGKVNAPTLLTGMTAIKFTDPTSTTEGTVVTTTASDASWYNYDAKKWANAQTQDGSMWVWIPRFAYKITYTDASDKSKGGTIDVVFLIGTTDNYYKADGTIGTAQRATETNEGIDTTADYTVHPAFTNESSINYANGGWDSELTGIWVAKFEAGYAGGNNTATAKNSSVAYTSPAAYVAGVDRGEGKSDGTDTARNYYKPTGYTIVDNTNGTMTYNGGTTKYSWVDGVEYIKYPVFQGLTFSMNYITPSDAYSISRKLTENRKYIWIK